MRQQPVDYSLKWYVMGAVVLTSLTGLIDVGMVNLALPSLVRAFDTRFGVVEWVILSFLLVETILALGMGRLGDTVGKKPLYVSGLIVFTIGSALCGLAPSEYWMIAFRVLQAVGAAAIVVLGRAILVEGFPSSERGRALGIGRGFITVGIVGGPILGGLILNFLSWRWIFIINLPLGLLSVLAVLRFVPDIRPEKREPFDYLGAGTLCLSMLGLVLGLTLGQRIGFDETLSLGLFAAFIGFLPVFVLVESVSTHPLVELNLFRDRLFSADLIMSLISSVCNNGVYIVLPFYLRTTLALHAEGAGFLMASLCVAEGVVAPAAGWLADRFGPRPIVVAGLSVMAAGHYLAHTMTSHTALIGVLLRFVVIGIGLGLFRSPNQSAIMGSVSRSRLGGASGLLSLTRTLGPTAGIAMLGALWSSRVVYYAGGPVQGGVTHASAAVQAAALNDTYRVTTGLILLLLALAIWTVIEERRGVTERAVPEEWWDEARSSSHGSPAPGDGSTSTKDPR